MEITLCTDMRLHYIQFRIYTSNIYAKFLKLWTIKSTLLFNTHLSTALFERPRQTDSFPCVTAWPATSCGRELATTRGCPDNPHPPTADHNYNPYTSDTATQKDIYTKGPIVTRI